MSQAVGVSLHTGTSSFWVACDYVRARASRRSYAQVISKNVEGDDLVTAHAADLVIALAHAADRGNKIDRGDRSRHNKDPHDTVSRGFDSCAPSIFEGSFGGV